MYLNIYPSESGSTKPRVVKSTPLTGARGKIFIEKMLKQNEEIICLAATEAVALLGKAQLAVCDWLSLSVIFSGLSTLILI